MLNTLSQEGGAVLRRRRNFVGWGHEEEVGPRGHNILGVLSFPGPSSLSLSASCLTGSELLQDPHHGVQLQQP